jgi:UDP-glucose 4-epimerase
MEIINTFSEHLNTKITFHVTKRRLGDLPVYFSKSEKAEKHLKWRAKKTLLDMCRDSLAWLQHYNK